ncbi:MULTISPECIES: DUF6286 domain-containing protein [unclassified Streptomyces]|uniref:DUF6286 domain-containing protein n=1 Tax=unclassified Streptomyces TaxID=2593676 RepID=UPI0022592902|nr:MULTISPECIES: DUF6286 domain-containing protein [unclassified Streptomyces]MCX4991850.1 DUF6286 domain-containing protein [Streptomyces sp. NBC_00568]MCX5002914.1 DUF6286 domain-containing protein [Streptomyces sp. NBC_00638]
MSEPQGSDSTRKLPVLEKADDAGALGQSSSAAAYEPLDTVAEEDGRQGRFWSARRVPAGILAILLLVAAGAFLYDVAAVRAGRSALRWRTWLAQQLAERPLDDTAVLVGAGIAAAVGLWLIVLAATPGLRDVLPMRRTHADVRAGLYRMAAAMALRDRAMEVAGVQSVRVRVKRRKVDVRAVSHFRELDDVRADLDTTLADGIKGLGLARSPALSVRVARPGRKG